MDHHEDWNNILPVAAAAAIATSSIDDAEFIRSNYVQSLAAAVASTAMLPIHFP